MSDTNSIDLNLYRSINGYVGKINIDSEIYSKIKQKDDCHTIIILDRSGSMGQQVPRLVNTIIPSFLESINYPSNRKITIFAFDDELLTINETIGGLKKYEICAGDTTYMQHALFGFENYILNIIKASRKSNDSKNLRILSISDGDIHDKKETVNLSTKIAKLLKDNNFIVNSQAIRLFTSRYGTPDTRGLASVLQFHSNNIVKPSVIDIDSSVDDKMLIGTMVNLFLGDGLDESITLETGNNFIKVEPWSSSVTNSSILFEGENTIWLGDIPKEAKIGGSDINIRINICDNINNDNFDSILNNKLNDFIEKVKILKVVGNTDAKKEIELITKYFNDLQLWLASCDKKDDDKLDLSLKSRVKYFKSIIQQRQKTIFAIIAQIANDNRVAEFNSNQQAEYLRTVEINKLSKALANRAMQYGLDFTSVLRKEVKEMASHINELDSIDDSDHQVSFFSQETTLGGIKALCELVQNGMIDSMEATEILQMINIVGIACRGNIGDYPDPMCWRADDIYPGCYISVSDITMAHIFSNKTNFEKGKPLKVPGIGKDIMNSIPIFDDPRIHIFLKKYAPSLLEYNASIGMRRVIAGIPLTHFYTICAGIWKMIEYMNNPDNKTTISTEMFIKLIKSFETAIGSHFDYILDFIKEQDENLTYFISNNGITNMIGPIMKLVGAKNTKYMSNILRSIYSFEAYQMIKKKIRTETDNNKFITDSLNSLLEIDFDKHGTNVTDLFQKNPKPEFYDKFNINKDNETYKQFSKLFWFIDFIALLAPMLDTINQKDPVSYMKDIKKMDEKMICDALGIDIDLTTFKTFTIVQAFLFNNKSKRVDDQNNKMKIVDIGINNNGNKLTSSYVKSQYENDYNRRLTEKKNKEKIKMMEKLVDAMTKEEDNEKFIKLFKEGLEYGGTTFKIANTNSLGYIELRQNLLNMNIDVPNRLDKITVFILGRHGDEIVWNNGSVLFSYVSEFFNVFKECDANDSWNELYKLYKARRVHVYRGMKSNRHGHCNLKPSYWALGYKTILDMKNNITVEEWEEYVNKHEGCCGIEDRKAKVQTKKGLFNFY